MPEKDRFTGFFIHKATWMFFLRIFLEKTGAGCLEFEVFDISL